MVIVLLTLPVFFTAANFSRGKRDDTRSNWIFGPAILITIAISCLPAYTDRRDILTIDGDATRYLGLALLVVGGVLRVWPIFVLGNRFSGRVAIQEGHRLETTGFYRYIRHPSYLGVILGTAGWVLVFRSGIGLLLVLLFVLLLIFRIPAEEALLKSEFGDEYDSYRRRTWRLLPFIY